MKSKAQSNLTALNVTGEGTMGNKQGKSDGSNLIYFVLNSTQIPSDAEYIRVTAAAQSSNNSPPPLYARLGNYPSRSIFDFNGTMNTVSQVILDMKHLDGKIWYLAIEATVDYLIWAGGL